MYEIGDNSLPAPITKSSDIGITMVAISTNTPTTITESDLQTTKPTTTATIAAKEFSHGDRADADIENCPSKRTTAIAAYPNSELTRFI